MEYDACFSSISVRDVWQENTVIVSFRWAVFITLSSDDLLGLVHSDISMWWNECSVTEYFVTSFINDKTRHYVWTVDVRLVFGKFELWAAWFFFTFSAHAHTTVGRLWYVHLPAKILADILLKLHRHAQLAQHWIATEEHLASMRCSQSWIGRH